MDLSDDRFSSIMDRKKAVALGIFMIVVFYAVVTGRITMQSYTSAYEGAKARFIGVRTGNDRIYTNSEKYNSSVAHFDSFMNWDPDGADIGYPNIEGEITPVFLPVNENIQLMPEWVPMEWWRGTVGMTNPIKEPWEWEIKNADGTWSKYTMEEWVTKWYVSFEAKYDSGPNAFTKEDEAEDQPRHLDLQVWVEFDISPTWYFEGADTAYFAIGKIVCDFVQREAIDNEGNIVEARDGLDFFPESAGSVLTIYDQPFGGRSYKDEGDIVTYAYRGTALNPEYFQDKVYTHIDLNNFGTDEWGNPLFGLHAKGDVVTIGFTVHQFVVGEWIVKDVMDLDDYDGRGSQSSESWAPLKPVSDFFTFFATPTGTFTLTVVATLVVLFLAAVYFKKLKNVGEAIGLGGNDK